MENTIYNRVHSLYGLLMTLALFTLTLTLGIPFFGAIIACELRSTKRANDAAL